MFGLDTFGLDTFGLATLGLVTRLSSKDSEG